MAPFHIPFRQLLGNLLLAGAYSRAICGEYVRKYFAKCRPNQKIYGMLPLQPGLGELAAEASCGLNFKHPDPNGDGIKVDGMSPKENALVESILAMFKDHLELAQLLADVVDTTTVTATPPGFDAKRPTSEPAIDGEGPAAKKQRPA